MSNNLQAVALLFIFAIMVSIIIILVKGKMYVKYSLIWLFSSLALFIAILFPGILNSITSLFGFQVASNMIFALLIGMLMFVCISLTIIISSQNEKIKLLIQEVSTIKAKTERKEKTK